MRLDKVLQWRKWGATKKVERLARKTKVRTLTIAAMCALGAIVVIGAATVRPQPATAAHDQQKNAAHDTRIGWPSSSAAITVCMRSVLQARQKSSIDSPAR